MLFDQDDLHMALGAERAGAEAGAYWLCVALMDDCGHELTDAGYRRLQRLRDQLANRSQAELDASPAAHIYNLARA